METLYALIDRLASWKVNQVQLYSEHTFAYRNHPEVHADASPFTADEIRALDAFCRERHVELVPNQNCLGHMNRWLQHPRYHGLALAPDGFVDPVRPRPRGDDARSREPGLARARARAARRVAPAVLEPAREHRSRRDVGAATRPARRVLRVDRDAARAARARRPRGDRLGRHVLGRCRRSSRRCPTASPCASGDTTPSTRSTNALRCLAAPGLPFWVAPGTSAWLSIGGRLTNAVENCRNAVAAALEHGGLGLLNTDWGDRGHLQQWPVSDPGFAYGAAVSWCLASNRDLDLGAALSAHAYDDPTGGLAAALLAIGDAHRAVTPQIPNHSILVMHLYFPQIRVGRGITTGITAAELDTVAGSLADARADAGACATGARRRARSSSKRSCGRSTCSSSSSTTHARASPPTARSGRSRRPTRDDFASRLGDAHRPIPRALARAQPPRWARRQRRLARQPARGVRDRTTAPTWGGWPARFT